MLSRSSALRLQVESALAHRVPSALTVREKPAPEVFPTGITALDQLTGMGGLPRSALTEICGPASSGRTSVLLSLLAQATSRQEACALVDASDAFHPESAQAAGVDLGRVLWVRCSSPRTQESLPQRTQRDAKEEHNLSPQRAQRTQRNKKENPEGQEQKLLPQRTQRDAKEEQEQNLSPQRAPRAQRRKSFDRLEQALKATDLLLQSGGFGLLVVDLADIAPEVARRVPLTSWFRFRRAVEDTATALVVLEQEPFARTCASLVLRFTHKSAKWSSLLASEFYATVSGDSRCAAAPAHATLLGGLELDVEVTRARKGAQSSGAVVMTQTAWAG